MLYVSVPKKVRIENKSDIASYKQIQALFEKHGFGIARFHRDGVTFYDRAKCVRLSVPITSMYSVSKKEFLLFLDILRRLDEAETKMVKMISWTQRVI